LYQIYKTLSKKPDGHGRLCLQSQLLWRNGRIAVQDQPGKSARTYLKNILKEKGKEKRRDGRMGKW
jgi:hypothetical protein